MMRETVWMQGEHIDEGKLTLRKKATIHQVTTMLATSKNVLFPGHKHLRITGTDHPTLRLLPERQRVISTGD